MVLPLEIYFILPKDNNHVVVCGITVKIGIRLFHILFCDHVVVGTPNYMAPEVILHHLYGHGVD